MSDSDRPARTAPIVLIMVILALIFAAPLFIQMHISLNGRYDSARQHYCVGYEQRSKLHSEWLRSIETGPATGHYEAKPSSANHPNYIECRDLAAQESMAQSTYAIFWLAVAQLVLSVIGVGLLVWNARLARAAVDATRDASEDSRNVQVELAAPYLVPEKIIVDFSKGQAIKIIAKHLGGIIHYRCEIRNIGNSVAKDIRVRLALGAKPKWIIQKQDSKIAPIEPKDTSDIRQTNCILHIDPSDRFTQYAVSEKSSCHIMINYADLFGEERFTEAVFNCYGKESIGSNTVLAFQRLDGEMRSGKLKRGKPTYRGGPISEQKTRRLIDLVQWE